MLPSVRVLVEYPESTAVSSDHSPNLLCYDALRALPFSARQIHYLRRARRMRQEHSNGEAGRSIDGPGLVCCGHPGTGWHGHGRKNSSAVAGYEYFITCSTR